MFRLNGYMASFRTVARIGARPLTRLLWALCSCVLLTAQLASAAVPVVADFDGDGQHDRVILDVDAPSQLVVWLSTTHSSSIIHSPTPVLRVVATDLDGDHRAELIASAAGSGLHVWTRGRTDFRLFRLDGAAPEAALSRPVRHSLDDEPARPVATLAPASVPTLALAGRTSPGAPTSGRRVRPIASIALPAQSTTATPFAPRPPPVPVFG